MTFLLLLLVVALVLVLVGVVIKGLFWLLVLGAIVFVVDLLLGAVRFRRGGRRPTR